MFLNRTTVLACALGALLAACGGGSGNSPAPAPMPVATTSPCGIAPIAAQASWSGFGNDAMHSGLSRVAAQDLGCIAWHTQVDLAPAYTNAGELLTHYGSPVVTARNTVILPVKRSASTFRVEARAGADGTLAWSLDSDYIMPPHNWTPSYNLTLTSANRLAAPGAGGKVLLRDDADDPAAPTRSVAFYSNALYDAHHAALDASVFIDTPITADASGALYFGFTALPDNPLGLRSGIARIASDGTATWRAAADMTDDGAMINIAMNAAPALSPDGTHLYVLVSSSAGNGCLAMLDAGTLAPRAFVKLSDPATNLAARVSDDSSASPAVGPDGDVYIGVLESSFGQHNGRGWMLHFDATLTQEKTPGSFGWDDTPSIVPASMVASYHGASSYLLMVKYNNYGGVGSGDSMNKLAILDPNATQTDPWSGTSVMAEVLTVLGVTRDSDYPSGVKEWCINTAAVDPATRSVIVNSEDGVLYRWDLSTNTLSQRIRLSSGLGQSYTPTAIGVDGKVYAISNAVLYAVGRQQK